LLVQGEMSATVFYFPGSYVKLLPDLRARLSKGQASSGNIKLGVSTNFDKLCGCVLQVPDAGLLLHDALLILHDLARITCKQCKRLLTQMPDLQ
jgi:hypothetical protein